MSPYGRRVRRNDRERVGLPDLDLCVLSVLYENELLPSRFHSNAADVLDAIAGAGVCGNDAAWTVLQRLAASWLLPMPLIDPHGNFGTMYDPAAHPRYVECRLSNAGQLAVLSASGRMPPLPIGLINGDLHLVLGLDFTLWDANEDDTPLSIRPPLPPSQTLEALIRLLDDPAVDDDEINATVAGPWLHPFKGPRAGFTELMATGNQMVRLTPFPCDDGYSHPERLVELSFGDPLVAMLRRWTGQISDPPATADALALLRDLLQPGRIAPLPHPTD